MIIGLGIDLCDIERMEELIHQHGFLKRYYSTEEITYIETKNLVAAQSAAAMFAAKEAALKALGTGLTLGTLKDIILNHHPTGQPYDELRGQAKERMKQLGGEKIHVSISHEGNMAVAVAIIEGAFFNENH